MRLRYPTSSLANRDDSAIADSTNRADLNPLARTLDFSKRMLDRKAGTPHSQLTVTRRYPTAAQETT